MNESLNQQSRVGSPTPSMFSHGYFIKSLSRLGDVLPAESHHSRLRSESLGLRMCQQLRQDITERALPVVTGRMGYIGCPPSFHLLEGLIIPGD